MSGPARKPASKFPHLRKRIQKNQTLKGAHELKSLRLKFSRFSGKIRPFDGGGGKMIPSPKP
jgi:hypothetical protein